jgi:hypothetical protein
MGKRVVRPATWSSGSLVGSGRLVAVPAWAVSSSPMAGKRLGAGSPFMLPSLGTAASRRLV